ncbi:hypothetical protein D3C86_1727110 [compost metagenome]
MEVQHDEFVRVSIKEQQYRVDQIVQGAVRAKAVVVKVEARSSRTGGVAKTDIKGAGAVGQLPGKSVVLTNRPMAEHRIVVGRFFVHSGVMHARPDDIGEFELIDFEGAAHPGLLVEQTTRIAGHGHSLCESPHPLGVKRSD